LDHRAPVGQAGSTKTVAKLKEGTTDLVDVLRQSERDIFDYFAEEVFTDESEEVQLCY
jgi:hypothetical protein